jgi:hypothetical protein
LLHCGSAAGTLEDKTELLRYHGVVATGARGAAAFKTPNMLPAVGRRVN